MNTKNVFKKEKSKKKRLIISLCVVLPVVIIAAGIAGVTLPLILSYNKNAYTEVPIVERSEEYVQPQLESQPEEYENVTLSEDDLGKDISVTEALPNNINQSVQATAPNSNQGWKNSFGRSENAKSVYGKTPIYKVEQKDPNIINILVLGTDARDVTKERGRSDAMIIVSYNKKSSSIKMVSILRDSLVPIEGHNWNRINAAYSFDGVGLAVNTVNEIFDLDIQHFVVIDFNGVKDFIDEIDGVDVTLTQAEADHYNQNGFMRKEVSAGNCHLDGHMALTYMRTRKLDSDFKRTDRQRKIIELVAKKIIEEKSISEMYDLADFAFKLVKTNIPITDIMGVIPSVVRNGSALNMQSQHVPYSDSYEYKYYNGMAIVSYNLDAAAARINEFIYG